MTTNPVEQLEELLCQQAYKAFTELVFPGQIECASVTGGPRDWNELPENYQKALNIGFGFSIQDSTQVYQQARSLLGLRTGDKALLAVEKDMSFNIAQQVKPLKSRPIVAICEALELYIRSTEEVLWIGRGSAHVVLICMEKPDYVVNHLACR
jgi:hypothetical protein